MRVGSTARVASVQPGEGAYTFLNSPIVSMVVCAFKSPLCSPHQYLFQETMRGVTWDHSFNLISYPLTSHCFITFYPALMLLSIANRRRRDRTPRSQLDRKSRE